MAAGFVVNDSLVIDPKPEIIYKENQSSLQKGGLDSFKKSKKVVKADKSVYVIINWPLITIS